MQHDHTSAISAVQWATTFNRSDGNPLHVDVKPLREHIVRTWASGQIDVAAELRLIKRWKQFSIPKDARSREAVENDDIFGFTPIMPTIDEMENYERTGVIPTLTTHVTKNGATHCLVHDTGSPYAAMHYGYRARGCLVINENIGAYEEYLDRDQIARLFYSAR